MGIGLKWKKAEIVDGNFLPNFLWGMEKVATVTQPLQKGENGLLSFAKRTQRIH